MSELIVSLPWQLQPRKHIIPKDLDPSCNKWPLQTKELFRIGTGMIGVDCI